jgi:hypothetical protein
MQCIKDLYLFRHNPITRRNRNCDDELIMGKRDFTLRMLVPRYLRARHTIYTGMKSNITPYYYYYDHLVFSILKKLLLNKKSARRRREKTLGRSTSSLSSCLREMKNMDIMLSETLKNAAVLIEKFSPHLYLKTHISE